MDEAIDFVGLGLAMRPQTAEPALDVLHWMPGTGCPAGAFTGVGFVGVTHNTVPARPQGGTHSRHAKQPIVPQASISKAMIHGAVSVILNAPTGKKLVVIR